MSRCRTAVADNYRSPLLVVTCRQDVLTYGVYLVILLSRHNPSPRSRPYRCAESGLEYGVPDMWLGPPANDGGIGRSSRCDQRKTIEGDYYCYQNSAIQAVR